MRRFGPGFLVAAAFIGPGTVTTASLAGATHGLTLAWAVVAAVAATLVLQEMAARLGAVGGIGLGEALRANLGWPAIALALFAIVFGNAAYQSGNLTGAALGIEALAGGSRAAWVLACALTAAALLMSGAYRAVEGALVALVGVMSGVFIATAAMIGPELVQSGLAGWRPAVPAGGGYLVLALVGTTVVPYNLFLHAAAAREKWRGVAAPLALREARRDAFIAVTVGGVVTLAILASAVPLYLAGIAPEDVAGLTRQLEPLLGPGARWLFAAGLFAAGLTSAITAPLAAAWATCGLLGWPADLRSARFRAVWAVILVVGAAFAVTGARPLQAIVWAQAANGLLLPIIAGFLLWAMNRPSLVPAARNGALGNSLGGLVVAFSIFLGLSIIYRVFFQ